MAVKKQSKEEKALDKEIETLFRRNHSGVQIDMMDIPKLFSYARAAKTEGRVEEAIAEFVQKHRKN